MKPEPCPHCKTLAKHGERIGCCSGCKVLFASQSAFDRHRRSGECLDVMEIGLVAHRSKTDPNAVMWGMPGTYRREKAS